MLMLGLVIGLAQAQDDGKSFEVIDPADWTFDEIAIDDMAQSWGSTWVAEEGHEVTYGIVENVDESNIFHFATRRILDDGSVQVSLFRYNTSTYVFERLMRIDNVGDAAWYVVGYDSGYVVYAETSGSYDRGACGEPIVSAADGIDGRLYRLPDNYSQSWSEGASEYPAADVDVQAARDRQTACEGQGQQ